MTGELFLLRERLANTYEASMRPRSNDRGIAEFVARILGVELASMRPRSNDRGIL